MRSCPLKAENAKRDKMLAYPWDGLKAGFYEAYDKHGKNPMPCHIFKGEGDFKDIWMLRWQLVAGKKAGRLCDQLPKTCLLEKRT